MVKLYYTPTSCGAANFIAAKIAGVHLETEQVDISTHTTASGKDFYSINPKGNVPCLVLDDGTILNENAATLQYIADLGDNNIIAPPVGTVERSLVQQALSYVGTEYHMTIGHLFNPNLDSTVRDYIHAAADRKLKYMNDHLIGNKSFLVGDKLSVADLYLYIALTWSSYINIDLSKFPVVLSYRERIGNLPEIQDAHAAIASNPSSI
eukprot:CAMPEP_0185024934 /NCGR_PEP_ID=MMETSP1103-20130426/8093_1 /TAXON_ID=36769 /ORGANISM="Paraphysomonas bandaiensis, Strain Caron Lab Isolate" /LENGTH=207 /DNA_ID=CAMNT_0027558031 /DNA_START=42 /DNA_END=665 /DNA_ORIENTATION=-